MKLFNKITSILSAIAVMSVFSISALAAVTSDATVEPSVSEVEANDPVTISVDLDTFEGINVLKVSISYDNTAFTVDTDDNEDYNFGSKKNPEYYPMYFNEDFLDAMYEEEFVGTKKWSLAYTNTGSKINLLWTDTKDNYAIQADDLIEYPNNTIALDFITTDGVVSGQTYSFPVHIEANNASNGATIEIDKVATVKAKGGAPDPIDEFEAEIDDVTGEVTFANTDKAALTPSAILEDNKVKVFSDSFTGVGAKTRFRITHNGETRKFGATIGDYFGITGSGKVDGIVKVAVVFPKGDTNDFTIESYEED